MSLSLFILGTLAEHNNHPYQIKKNLLDVLPVGKLSEGKFYYNFESLHKKGYIKPVETAKIENRPSKTTYAITAAGREYLEQSIYDTFKYNSNVPDLYISVYLLKFVDPLKVVFYLEERVRDATKHLNKTKQDKNEGNWTEQLEGVDELTVETAHFIADHAVSNYEFNLHWLEKMLQFVQSTIRADRS